MKVARRAGLATASLDLPSDPSSSSDGEEDGAGKVDQENNFPSTSQILSDHSAANGSLNLSSFTSSTSHKQQQQQQQQQSRAKIVKQQSINTALFNRPDENHDKVDEFFAASGSRNNFIPSQPRLQRTPVALARQRKSLAEPVSPVESTPAASATVFDDEMDRMDGETTDKQPESAVDSSSSGRRKSVMFQTPARQVDEFENVDLDFGDAGEDYNDTAYDSFNNDQSGERENVADDECAVEIDEADESNKEEGEVNDLIIPKSKSSQSKPKKSAMKKRAAFSSSVAIPAAPLTAEDEIRLKIFNKGGLKEISTDDGQLVKRSSRMRYRPLEFWRNERVVFGRRKSGK